MLALLVHVLSPLFLTFTVCDPGASPLHPPVGYAPKLPASNWYSTPCLLYTSDAADERSSVDLGGRRIIKKKTFGTGLMVMLALLVHVLSPLFLTFTVCDPGASPLHPPVGYAPKLPASNWYSTPVAGVSVIVPVGTLHVGCVAASTGCSGFFVFGLLVVLGVLVYVFCRLFLMCIVCGPGASPLRPP